MHENTDAFSSQMEVETMSNVMFLFPLRSFYISLKTLSRTNIMKFEVRMFREKAQRRGRHA